jgi:hypothetical protein
VRPRRFLALAALTLGCLAAGAWPAVGQGENALVVVEPEAGGVSGSDVHIVVRLNRLSETGSTASPAGSPVQFVVTIDGLPAGLVDEKTGKEVAVASAADGRDARVVVRGVPDGLHRLRVVPVSEGSVRAPEAVAFTVKSRPPTPLFIGIALAGIAILLFYRRRILEPWADRYERPPPAGSNDEDA